MKLYNKQKTRKKSLTEYAQSGARSTTIVQSQLTKSIIVFKQSS